MQEHQDTTIQYPIGRFNPVDKVTPELIKNCFTQLDQQPILARKAVEGLSEEQIDTAYREGGWTVRQVIHHLADAHINFYVRFKLALTENNPTIKTYAEEKWAELEDGRKAPVNLSLTLIDAIHARLIIALRSLQQEDYKKAFLHPDLGLMPLEQVIQLYSWHGNHHIAQIMSLREQRKW